jgi:hypothetical protein
MNMICHSYSIASLPVIAGLIGLFNISAVNAGTPGDACALLTPPQVSSALGVSVGSGKPVMPNNSSICTWSEQGAPAGAARNVTVSLMNAKSFENGKIPMTGITKTPVSGIGDDAYFIQPRGVTTALSVRKGDACFQVRALSNPEWFKKARTPESEQKDQDVERALATEILKKL